MTAINHFSENFREQGFDGKKWKDVKRRDPESPWYGFRHGAKAAPPNRHPKRKGAKSDYKPRNPNPVTHYSPVARDTPILSSQESELENSIRFKARPGKVTVYSDKDYAKVHNEGGIIKVFGKKSVKLPKRQFIGKSKALDKKLKKAIEKVIRG